MTDRLIIQGGKKLSGTLQVDGAKNSAVALIPAAILAESEVVLEGLPDISDVYTLYDILEELGGSVRYDNKTAIIDPTDMLSMPLPSGNVKKLRASYYLMGAMLGRFKKAVIGLPGAVIWGRVPSINILKDLKHLAQK